MTAGCDTSVDGLVSNHVYSVLDTAELKNAAGKIVYKIVQIRNPWSAEKYHGPFSDKSKLWTPAWKKQVGWTDANDGKLWLPLHILRKAMAGISIAYTDKLLPKMDTHIKGKGHTW